MPRQTPKMTPAQIRAARAALALSRKEVALAANVSYATVADIERRKAAPRAPHRASYPAYAKVCDALEAGLEAAGGYIAQGRVVL